MGSRPSDVLASSFFDSIKVGPHQEEYLDGATGSNNPVARVWRAAKDLWPQDKIQCLVSIGTGQPSVKRFGDSPLQIWQTLLDIATETEDTAEDFMRDHIDLYRSQRCFRFNVAHGLEDVGLEDSSQKNVIAACTRRYISSGAAVLAFEACAKNLSTRECASTFA